jgi:hypothetical protein
LNATCGDNRAISLAHSNCLVWITGLVTPSDALLGTPFAPNGAIVLIMAFDSSTRPRLVGRAETDVQKQRRTEIAEVERQVGAMRCTVHFVPWRLLLRPVELVVPGAVRLLHFSAFKALFAFGVRKILLSTATRAFKPATPCRHLPRPETTPWYRVARRGVPCA